MPEGHVRMGVSNQLRAIDNGFAIVASFPELKNIPIVIGESDPEGCAACHVRTNPSNAYRNGTMYSSYTAEQIARTYELADLHEVNLLGSVTWAFEFEDQPYFDGFRDLATNGIDKPVLNVFRMLGHDARRSRRRGEHRRAAARRRARHRRARAAPTSTRSPRATARSIAVLVWNYHDDDLPAPAAEIELTIDGAAGGREDAQHALSRRSARRATRTRCGRRWARRSSRRRRSTRSWRRRASSAAIGPDATRDAGGRARDRAVRRCRGRACR